MQRTSEAIHLFGRVVQMIDSMEWEDRNRARLLRRLALGQINYLRHQPWNLEKEV